MTVLDRLLKYVTIMTPSDENSGQHPSSDKEFVLARELVRELKELGVDDAYVDEKCFVYAQIPESHGYEGSKTIGYIAHMDTVSDFATHQVKPLVHENYDGKILELGTSGRKLDPAVLPHLSKLAGRTLITSDGTTILGADDKAGIAVIMTFAEYVMTHEDYKHGAISIAFTPDEEIGEGADYFRVDDFCADYAFTLDGSSENEIQYENFNAAGAEFFIQGVNVHPGDAKDVMVNAAAVACEIQGLLPAEQVPEHTEGYEGFFHLTKMEGTVEKAHLSYIVRDFDQKKFQEKKELLRKIELEMQEKYGEDKVKLELKDQYQNMRSQIEPCMHLIDHAVAAVKASGLTPEVVPIRGGTDGARLSFMGLPCPNLGTGGYSYHGPFEHVTKEGMEIAVDNLIHLTAAYAKRRDEKSAERFVQDVDAFQ